MSRTRAQATSLCWWHKQAPAAPSPEEAFSSLPLVLGLFPLHVHPPPSLISCIKPMQPLSGCVTLGIFLSLFLPRFCLLQNKMSGPDNFLGCFQDTDSGEDNTFFPPSQGSAVVASLPMGCLHPAPGSEDPALFWTGRYEDAGLLGSHRVLKASSGPQGLPDQEAEQPSPAQHPAKAPTPASLPTFLSTKTSLHIPVETCTLCTVLAFELLSQHPGSPQTSLSSLGPSEGDLDQQK